MKAVKWISLSDILDHKLPPEKLIQDFKSFNWIETIIKLSHIAAIFSNQGGFQSPNSQAKKWVFTQLEPWSQSLENHKGIIYDFLQAKPNGLFVVEQSIYFLQALALLEGSSPETESNLGVRPKDLFGAWY